MKLSDYAKKIGISYKTAHRWWKAGQLSGYQLPSGTIIISAENPLNQESTACIYARVDRPSEIEELEIQVQKLQNYAIAKGYKIYKIHQEVASGYSDQRKLLNQALRDDNYNILLVENWDKLAQNGANYIKILLEKTGKRLEFLNYACSLINSSQS